jgi:hypothetical protein
MMLIRLDGSSEFDSEDGFNIVCDSVRAGGDFMIK